MQLSQAIPYVESSGFQTQESADHLTEDIYDRKLTQGIPFKTPCLLYTSPSPRD